MTGRLIQVAWELLAGAFLVGVVLVARKARARGQRLFVDEPAKRIEKLRQSPVDRTQGW